MMRGLRDSPGKEKGASTEANMSAVKRYHPSRHTTKAIAPPACCSVCAYAMLPIPVNQKLAAKHAKVGGKGRKIKKKIRLVRMEQIRYTKQSRPMKSRKNAYALKKAGFVRPVCGAPTGSSAKAAQAP